MVDRFEAEIADRVGVRHALALSSGTAALHLALLAEGAGPGKAVVLPSMTFAATANAVLYTGAEPVFVDSSPTDANVDIDLLVSAVDTLLAEGRDIACVLAVDLFGRCIDYSRLVPELRMRGVPLIEDAAEALGASHAGAAAGSFGHSAALSFNGNKIMTTSGGGMLLSDDAELISHARYLSTQARQPVPWYEHTEMGFNYRMSNILAALGVGQLSRLDDMIMQRRRHRERYALAFADLPGVRLLGGGLPEDASNDNCWLTCLVMDPGLGTSADAVVTELGKQEIEARHLWKPMHLQPLYSSARAFLTGGSESLFAHGVTLPSGSELSDTDIDRVISALTGILKGKVEAA
jgi:dTDP-4-amino-4,6-dideoxygalactose transaminase